MMRKQRTAIAIAATIASLAGGGGVAWACVGPGMGDGMGTTTSTTGTTGTTGTTATTTDTTTTGTTASVRRSTRVRHHRHHGVRS